MQEARIRLDRRQFCRGMLAGLTGSSVALAGAAGAIGMDTGRERKTASLGIARLRLQTHRLAELRAFYREKLQFPVREETQDSVTFQAGTTSLTFVQTEPAAGQPFYHFAFNIPENQLSQAKEWLAERTPLAADGKVYHFTHWNAHAIYFWDPAGNLGELIARHDLPNAREVKFTADDILYASEIGLVVEEVPAAIRELKRRLALRTYRQRSKVFEALGDEHCLLIVVQKGRPWLDRESKVFPTAATLYGTRAGRCDLAAHPYVVDVRRQG